MEENQDLKEQEQVKISKFNSFLEKIKFYKKPITIVFIAIFLPFLFTTILFFLFKTNNSNYQNNEEFVKQEDAMPNKAEDNASESAELSENSQENKESFLPPEDFGYIKVTDLPGLGLRLSIPVDAKVTRSEKGDSYQIAIKDSGEIYVSFREYDGGSRREWFLKNIGPAKFMSFSANKHNGYIAYSEHNGKYYNIYYISVVGPNKILFFSYPNIKSIDQFKSLLSTLFIISPNQDALDRVDQPVRENIKAFRHSDKRMTVWEDDKYGLKITAPEWIDFRFPKGDRKEDGSWEYGEWNRTIPEARKDDYEQYQGITIVTGLPNNWNSDSISFFGEEYKGKSFQEVAEELIIPSSFCSEGWHESKSDCESPEYCYTKNEVINNLFVEKTHYFGQYEGQLRSLRADFNQINDCRAPNRWLIRAKNGKFVESEIHPDNDLLSLEAF